MNEGAKTGIFWLVAAVMVAIATFVAWPRAVDTDTSKLIGKQLFPDFEDPLVAASMRIVTYDDEQATLSQFEVAKDPQTGVWKIPSHAGYPADAEDQMKASATALFDLAILDVPSRNAEDHAQFGVLEPDPEGLKVGDEGVGRLVDFRDDQGEKLATLIVGHEVPNLPQQRYVRKPTQDVVYVVELDDSSLTTRFVDWIDKDLLELTAFDIDRVTLNNYTASFDVASGRVAHNKKFEADLGLEGADWNLERLVTFKEGVGVPKPLGEGEVLNTEKLNALKQALDELEIAGVGRKPEGMSANLKADKSLISDQGALLSLLERGFIPVGSADSEEVDILAANGELVVTQKDGVEYVLRFGETAEGSDADANVDGESASSASNRYLLVTARVNESQIPAPDLKESPETIEELDAAENATDEDQPADGAAAEDPAAQPPSTLTAVPVEAGDLYPADDAEEMKTEEATDASDSGSDEPSDEPASDDEPAEDQPTADDDAAADADAPSDPETSGDSEETDSDETESEENDSEENSADETESDVTESSAAEAADGEQVDVEESVEESSTESSQADGESASDSDAGEDAADPPASESDSDASDASAEGDSEATPAGDEPTGDEPSDAEAGDAESEKPEQPEETEQEKQERLEAAQERIAKENQRELDEREEKIQKARQRVAELNARFADWYYEISDATFRNLRLSQEELIISEEEAAAQQSGPPGGMPQGGFPQGGAMPQFGPPGAR